jgi:hypothetical protein
MPLIRITRVHLLAASGILGAVAFGACVYVGSTYPYNSVQNDTGDAWAHCEEPRFVIGPPDFIRIRPGEKAKAASEGCFVYNLETGSYLGCLQLGKDTGSTLLLSTYDSSIPSDRCQFGSD